MSYEDECDWFTIHGNQAQEAAESEFNASFDDDRERYAGLGDDPAGWRWEE